MKFKFLLMVFGIIVAVMLPACSNDESAPEPQPEPSYTDLNLSEAESRANEGLAGFNNRFFGEVAQANQTSNFAVSPLGASMLLSLTANGVDAEVCAQILAAMECENLTALNTLSRRYMDVLPVIDPKVTMNVANGYWYSDRYTLSANFNDVLTNSYDGTARSGHFENPEPVAAEINAWVNDKTAGMIRAIYETPESIAEILNLIAVTVNAIYIKGAWYEPFDAAKTQCASFYGMKGEVTVDMMHHEGYAYYQEGENFSAVRLPLGDGHFYATFVMPDKNKDVDGLITGDVHSLLDFRAPSTVDLYLPKVDFQGNEMALTQIFKNMGMTKLGETRPISIFNEPAAASHIIRQKAAVRFNEDGAEASAVTWDGWAIAPEPGYIPDVDVFRADRPFLFFIDEANTGAAILWGCIRNL